MTVVHVTKENFEKEIKESKTPVIIDFWAGWCGPCQMLGPVFEELAKDFSDKLKFVKVNVDENAELANEFQVQGIPALVVIDKMAEKDRIVGFASKDVLKQKIVEILEKI